MYAFSFQEAGTVCSLAATLLVEFALNVLAHLLINPRTLVIEPSTRGIKVRTRGVKASTQKPEVFLITGLRRQNRTTHGRTATWVVCSL